MSAPGSNEYDQWVENLQTEPPPPPPEEEEATPASRVILTRASEIKVRRVRWLWDQRIAYGTLALLAGREGLGKSTLAYQIAADVTRGQLDGEDKGTPRAVIICASEDSWEHTIVPRLIAARADLDLVYRVEIKRADYNTPVSLPKDFLEVAYVAQHTGAGLMILDPLMSAIDTRLDTHRDRELRQALEPLAKLADNNNMSILGLIHHNKSGSTDPLQLVMGSKAFTAVARSVSTVIPDPDDENEERRMFGTPKNNLGRDDLPMLGFTLSGHAVETEDDGVAWTARINWLGEVVGSMREVMSRAADPDASATSEAVEWLRDHLLNKGGEDSAKDIQKASRAAGHVWRTIQRAKQRARVKHYSSGFPRQTWWYLPEAIDRSDHGHDGAGDGPVDITEPRRSSDPEAAEGGATGQSRHQSRQPGGATGVADNSVAPDPSGLPQSRLSRQSMARLGATGADLQKRDSTRTRERTCEACHVGATESWRDCETECVADKSPVAPVAPSTPQGRAPARDPDPPPQPPPTPVPDLDVPVPDCPDCHHPIDSADHERICEEMP